MKRVLLLTGIIGLLTVPALASEFRRYEGVDTRGQSCTVTVRYSDLGLIDYAGFTDGQATVSADRDQVSFQDISCGVYSSSSDSVLIRSASDGTPGTFVSEVQLTLNATGEPTALKAAEGRVVYFFPKHACAAFKYHSKNYDCGNLARLN